MPATKGGLHAALAQRRCARGTPGRAHGSAAPRLDGHNPRSPHELGARSGVQAQCTTRTGAACCWRHAAAHPPLNRPADLPGRHVLLAAVRRAGRRSRVHRGEPACAPMPSAGCRARSDCWTHKRHGGAGQRVASLPPHQRAAPAMPRARGRDPVGRAHHARALPGLAGAQPAHPGASTSSRRRLVSSATRSSGNRKCSSYASPSAAAPPRRGRRARPPSGPVAAADARHISAWPTASTHACARAPLGRPSPGARRAHRGSQAGALSLLVLGRSAAGRCGMCARSHIRTGPGSWRGLQQAALGARTFARSASMEHQLLHLWRVGVAVAAPARARLAVGAV